MRSERETYASFSGQTDKPSAVHAEGQFREITLDLLALLVFQVLLYWLFITSPSAFGLHSPLSCAR